MREDGLSLHHVFVVLAAPGEGLAALADFEAFAVDALEVRDGVAESLRQVVSSGGDEAHGAKMAGGGGEVDG